MKSAKKLQVLNAPTEKQGVFVIITTFYNNYYKNPNYRTYLQGKNPNTSFHEIKCADYKSALVTYWEFCKNTADIMAVLGSDEKAKTIIQLVSNIEYSIGGYSDYEVSKQLTISNF